MRNKGEMNEKKNKLRKKRIGVEDVKFIVVYEEENLNEVEGGVKI